MLVFLIFPDVKSFTLSPSGFHYRLLLLQTRLEGMCDPPRPGFVKVGQKIALNGKDNLHMIMQLLYKAWLDSWTSI